METVPCECDQITYDEYYVCNNFGMSRTVLVQRHVFVVSVTITLCVLI